MKLASLVLSLAVVLVACGGSKKKVPAGPAADDVPQEVTCCVVVSAEGIDQRSVVPVDQCPEDLRNTVDACDVGPGDAEPLN